MRIVHEYHALSLNHSTHRIQFQLHAEIADRLLRLDERSADVMIANQRHPKWNSGFSRVADRRRHAGIRYRRNNIRLHRMLARQQVVPAVRGSDSRAGRKPGYRAAKNRHARKCSIDAVFPARTELIRCRCAKCAPSRPAPLRERTPHRSDRMRRFPNPPPRRRQCGQ